MKFITGDDIGILKAVHVESKKVERFGPQRRGDAAERLCWAGPASNREARLAVAFASGAIESRDGASGQVVATVTVPPKVRCLHPFGSSLLAVSENGTASVVKEWCGEADPVTVEEEEEEAADGEAPAAAKGEAPAVSEANLKEEQAAATANAAASEAVQRHILPSPVGAAQLDPRGTPQLVFGGKDNDVKIFDLEQGKITWRAKAMRKNWLCLRPPVKVSALSWATQMEAARSLILCGTTDGKIRLYDARSQRRAYYEILTGFRVGQGSGGWTGVEEDIPRPVNCSTISQVRGDGWSLFVGNTMGALREYDLRLIPQAKPTTFIPDKKSHMLWSNNQLPYKRGYRGIMGSIRQVDVHCNGEALVAVTIGRFAYLFETHRKRMTSKVYLKQKLCSVLWSSEERKETKPEESDEEKAATDEENDNALAPPPEPEGDQVEYGLSDDDLDDQALALDLEAGDEADGDRASKSARKGKKRKQRPASKPGSKSSHKGRRRFKEAGE